MLAPLSWLKEFVDITLPPHELGERLTEVGLGTQKITKVDDDTIFEFEITPNRPDLLSIIGIAREIAAIEGKKIKLKSKDIIIPKTPKLPIKLNPNYKLFHRWTGISIEDVTIKPSPEFICDRLIKLGLRPINNIIDITNYVMFELGIPLHAFDYDEIKGHQMTVELSKGGEKFTTVDEKTYHLPKNAIIIKDNQRVIDLAGIKGGLNSGINNKTKNVFLHVTIDDPTLVRRASIALSLRSDASAIYERGTDKGGTIDTLKRAAFLIQEYANGKIASSIYDLKSQEIKPWKLNLRIERLNKILGIEIPEKNVTKILDSLNLSPIIHKDIIECIIPTYRNDLKIEEDLIEEVARLYGYNNFPKSIPLGEIPTKKIPHFRDFRLDEMVKNIFTSCGFSEIYTYSLISEDDLKGVSLNPDHTLRVDNPVSREFEYLRPTLKTNLLKALKLNIHNFKNINLFELGKVYIGKNLNEAREKYFLSGISNSKNYLEIKGILEYIFDKFGINLDATKYIDVLDDSIFFELNYSEIITQYKLDKKFKPLPKYPPIIEDLAIIADEKIKTFKIIDEIKKQSPLIVNVSLLDIFENTRTFRVIYQHKERNLTTEEISKIREKILKNLKEKLHAILKE